jgi:hypothetical protein
MERRPAAWNRWSQLDPGDDLASGRSAIDELSECAASREQLSSPRAQFRERTAGASEHEPQADSPESLRHVPAVDEEKLEAPVVSDA